MVDPFSSGVTAFSSLVPNQPALTPVLLATARVVPSRTSPPLSFVTNTSTQLCERTYSVTDANLFLGRIQPDFFPKIFGPTEDMPLDYEITKKKFEELTAQINKDTGGNKTPEEIASG